MPDGSSPRYRETCAIDMDSTRSPEYVHRFDLGTAGEENQTIEVYVSEIDIAVLYHDQGDCDVQILGCADRVETAIEDVVKYLETKHRSATNLEK